MEGLDRRTVPGPEPAIAPGKDGRDRWKEIMPHVGQEVLVPRRVVLIERLGQNSGPDGFGEPIRERIRAMPSDFWKSSNFVTP